MIFSGYSLLGSYGWMAVSIISTAFYFVLTSAFMRKHSQVSMNYMVAVTHGMAALMLLVFIDQPFAFDAMPQQLWKNLLLVALLTWIAKIFYFYAYSRMAVANVTVFSALTPLYAAIIAPFMGYPLSNGQILGIVIITGSVFVFFAKDFTPLFVNSRLKFALPSGTMICAFFSTIPTAASSYFQKDAILLSDPLYVSFFICAFAATASFCYFLAISSSSRKKGLATVRTLTVFKPLLVIALLQAIAALAFSAFIMQGHPAVGQALQRLSSLLQILLAHIFLHQRLNTVWHILCVGFSIVGIYVLNLG